MPALQSPADSSCADHHKVVIVGAGAAGIATASSLISRDPSLDIAVIDPADVHYYQPGWTMVGAGVFDAPSTARTMASTIPRGVRWIKARVERFDPQAQLVMLEDGRAVSYEQLVVCPGLKLDWNAIEGLSDTLGRNGVTSNYRYDLAPYTWQLVQNLKKAVPSSPSRQCQSSAPVRPRKRCTCPVTIGCAKATWARSRPVSSMPARCCSACLTMFRP